MREMKDKFTCFSIIESIFYNIKNISDIYCAGKLQSESENTVAPLSPCVLVPVKWWIIKLWWLLTDYYMLDIVPAIKYVYFE